MNIISIQLVLLHFADAVADEVTCTQQHVNAPKCYYLSGHLF